ncbi:hypothetical protein SAMN05216480_12322 [Pustulibacterium marinum]|uniref:Uncharacterized protein n=1 Tax=Pustulibacterium marinum TaxID=1224947 RepID=A0A1I7IW64_9FLAO|nr:hypothetical protein [Pustulibacterium marinum]SFU77139.1 hypothetical protein SAMN05216480_12322 [Pustulibacterium marinum]
MSKNSKHKLRNPAALITAASNPEIVKTAGNIVGKSLDNQATIIAETGDFLKKLFLIAGVAGGVYLTHKQYKKYRRKKYLEANISNPNIQAAIIINDAFLNFEPSGVLSWFLPSFNISTDTSQLYTIAENVTDLTEVAKAYNVVFDRNLSDDLSQASGDVYISFMNIINNKGDVQVNEATGTYDIILAGDTVYSAVNGSTLTVKKAVYNDDAKKWQSTNELYENFSYGDEIGKVVTSVLFTENPISRYYIVEKGGWLGIGATYGLVWDNEITNKKIK